MLKYCKQRVLQDLGKFFHTFAKEYQPLRILNAFSKEVFSRAKLLYHVPYIKMASQKRSPQSQDQIPELRGVH